IERELKQKNISSYCIQKAMMEIDEEDYLNTLRSEIARRDTIERKAKHPWLRRRKLADYLVKRGFEASLVWEILDELGIGK
ncbi:MAG: RecX family transcriptional regulator, partial [Bacteroidota bacterium]